jgi:tetratricopeptide (TPR) repeat protein
MHTVDGVSDQEALQCLDKALEIDPRYANAWALKRTVLDILKRPREAIQCLDKALEINPQNARVQQLKRIISAAK